ncbi:hypothetical protein FOA52_016227 [Chlamydomonas sp. UWO 241]|nr:hypothetical protein FOA52_016227 [Chlamydomonas sp. UWO 241]
MAEEGSDAVQATVSGKITVEALIAALDALGDDVSYTATMLRASYKSQQSLFAWLSGLSDREEMGIAEVDAVLLQWLHTCYLYVSSVPGLSSGAVPLAPLIAFAGLLRPFIGVEGSRLLVGLPSKEDEVAESLSELLRMAGAAVVTYQDYLSSPARARSVPSDDAALLFASMTIRSCQEETTREALDAEAVAAAQLALSLPCNNTGNAAHGAADADAAQASLPKHARLSGFGVPEIRWLMHWLRSELSCHFASLSCHFASVRFIVGDRIGHKDSLVAAQADKLCLLKLVPSNLAAYTLYCRSCLQFQQTKLALLFATKGLQVADALRDDAHKAQLLLVRATAAALGGGGPTFSAKAVADAHTAALASQQACVAWMPEQIHVLLDLSPELTIIADKVLGEHVAAAAAAGGGDDVPCVDMIYTIPEPTSLPPGAVEEQEEEAAGGGGAVEGKGEGGGEGVCVHCGKREALIQLEHYAAHPPNKRLSLSVLDPSLHPIVDHAVWSSVRAPP